MATINPSPNPFQPLLGKTSLILGGSLALAGSLAPSLQMAGAAIILGFSADEETAAIALANTLGGADGAVRIAMLRLDDSDALLDQLTVLGKLDIVIVTPGWFERGTFIDSTPEDWDAALYGNFEQPVYVIKAASHYLKTQGEAGRLIVLSSVSTFKALEEMSAVSTSLAALQAVARLAAVELAPDGITVNVVAMGWREDGWAGEYVNAQTRHAIEGAIPAGRLAESQDLGAAICFLASDAAQYITGVVLPVDGGYVLHKSDVPPPPRKPDHVGPSAD